MATHSSVLAWRIPGTEEPGRLPCTELDTTEATQQQQLYLTSKYKDFLGAKLLKNLPCNAGDMGLIPGWGAKIPHAMEQISLRVTTTEHVHCN